MTNEMQEIKPENFRFLTADSSVHNCPFCGSVLDDAGGMTDSFCYNDACEFFNSEVVQSVIQALIGEGRNSYEAVEIAATYVTDEEAQNAVQGGFVVNDIHSANWVLRQIAGAELAAAQAEEALTVELDRLAARTEAILKPLRRRIEFFKAAYASQIEGWAKAEIAVYGGKKKSMDLLYGTVGFRKSSDSVEVSDEERAILWAEVQEFDHLIKKTLAKSEFKKGFDRYYELDPVTVSAFAIKVPGEDKFYIKASVPALAEVSK